MYQATTHPSEFGVGTALPAKSAMFVPASRCERLADVAIETAERAAGQATTANSQATDRAIAGVGFLASLVVCGLLIAIVLATYFAVFGVLSELIAEMQQMDYRTVVYALTGRH